MTGAIDAVAMRRVAVGSAMGTALEYYDFGMYGIAASLVFGSVFFPESSSVAASLATFATFAVGFVSRPIGGLVFGSLGDRLGRKPVLLITLLLMGAATTAIGLLPGYHTLGAWAPGALVALRIVQGLAVGGESSGGQLLIIEHASDGARGRYGSLVQAASPIGIFCSGGLMLLFSASLSEADFLRWGWRVPFLLSSLVVAVGVFVRLRVSESPAFQDMKRDQRVTHSPVTTLLRRQPRALVLAILVFGTGISFYLNSVYAVTYAKDRGMSSTTLLSITTVVALVVLPVLFVSGRLADRVGRKPVLVTGVAISVVVMVFYFPLIDTGRTSLVFVAMLLTASGFFVFWAVQATIIAEQFDVRVRYSAVALSTSLGTVLFGGLAPFIATALLDLSRGSPWTIAVYAVLGQLVGLTGILFMREGGHEPMLDSQADVHEVLAREKV